MKLFFKKTFSEFFVQNRKILLYVEGIVLSAMSLFIFFYISAFLFLLFLYVLGPCFERRNKN